MKGYHHTNKRPWKRTWDRDRLRDELLSRRVITETGCWVMPGAPPTHYDLIRIEGQNWGLHQVALWIWRGLPPSEGVGPLIGTMHTCDNPPCWNPDHLLRATQAANVQDAITKGRKLAKWTITQCKWGHELTPENTYIKGRARHCRICRRQRRRECYLRQRGAA